MLAATAYLLPDDSLLELAVQDVLVEGNRMESNPVTPDIAVPFDLRYAVGTGLRIATPIGPLVFDYGFNVDRVLDDLFPKRDNQRFWEDIGAFHFSIGLF